MKGDSLFGILRKFASFFPDSWHTLPFKFKYMERVNWDALQIAGESSISCFLFSEFGMDLIWFDSQFPRFLANQNETETLPQKIKNLFCSLVCFFFSFCFTTLMNISYNSLGISWHSVGNQLHVQFYIRNETIPPLRVWAWPWIRSVCKYARWYHFCSITWLANYFRRVSSVINSQNRNVGRISIVDHFPQNWRWTTAFVYFFKKSFSHFLPCPSLVPSPSLPSMFDMEILFLKSWHSTLMSLSHPRRHQEWLVTTRSSTSTC